MENCDDIFPLDCCCHNCPKDNVMKARQGMESDWNLARCIVALTITFH